jgi:hypothetical protein
MQKYTGPYIQGIGVDIDYSDLELKAIRQSKVPVKLLAHHELTAEQQVGRWSDSGPRLQYWKGPKK